MFEMLLKLYVSPYFRYRYIRSPYATHVRSPSYCMKFKILDRFWLETSQEGTLNALKKPMVIKLCC
jgi:hypothetical protein